LFGRGPGGPSCCINSTRWYKIQFRPKPLYFCYSLRSEKVVCDLVQLCTKLFENLFRSEGVAYMIDIPGKKKASMIDHMEQPRQG
jgi:hypothetical protein